ncbi:MAG: GDSL-type esterase/lipase family protein [Bacteroidota bacterium]
MILNRIAPFFLVLVLFFSACKEEEIITPSPPSIVKNTIMPLGASRVEGADSFESYRYELWKQLVSNNWEVDYVGTNADPRSYADVQNQRFDADHEGRGGWTSGQILQGIEGWLAQTGAPDIVLFSSPGGNDALLNLSYDQAIQNINAIIDAIQAVNPNVTIIVEQLAPARSELMTGDLATYFEQMQSDIVSIATNQTTSTSSVITVDMATGFTDDLLADDVHYNQAGAEFIAARYYEALQTVLVQ